MRVWALAAVLALSGCSAAGPAAAPTSVSEMPKPSDQVRLAATMLTEDQGASLALDSPGGPVPFMPSQNKKFALVSACATPLATDAKIVRAEQQTWQGDHYALAELSIQYQGIDAAEAVAEAQRVSACRAEIGSGKVDPVDVPPAPGVDAASAFCTLGDYDMYYCFLAEARDDLAAAAEFRYLGIADAAEQESARSFTQRLAAELAHGLERA
ncbi:hypothetical protein ACWEKJ_39455 [Amycolatopsis thermoflava]